MKTRLLAIAVLGLFGAARLHFEQRLTEEHRGAFFHTARLDLDLRQRLGQTGFLAALSGFRAVLADIIWLQAHSAFEQMEWGRMKLQLDTVTSLQPRAVYFWDMAAWHMAWNASAAARYDKKQPREALRIKAQREYFKIGEDLLLRGLQNNPDRPELYQAIARLYHDKFEDHEKAYAAFEKCATFPGAPETAHRFAAFELALIPGREREAYNRLSELYRRGRSERVPTLLTDLRELEVKLNVPPDQRIPTSDATP